MVFSNTASASASPATAASPAGPSAAGLTPVFVYGTLLTGMRNHPLIAGSAYAGTAELPGYRLFDLGAYPGIKPDPAGEGTVLGELYLCDAATMRDLDILEGVGVLYDRATEKVRLGGAAGAGTAGAGSTVVSAQVYVYRGAVEASAEIPVSLQPYARTRALARSHVWYVCYGSNLLRERFAHYIEGGVCRFNGRSYGGCSDRTMPLADAAVELPFDVYFGNTSGSWGGCGAAFLDVSRPGHAWGRAYLVSREQYVELWATECRAASWYHDEVELGRMAGIPLVTFTNLQRRPANAPSAVYLDVMRAGLAETFFGRLDGAQIERYLAEAVAR